MSVMLAWRKSISGIVMLFIFSMIFISSVVTSGSPFPRGSTFTSLTE